MKKSTMLIAFLLVSLVFTTSSFATTLLDENFEATDGGFVSANYGSEGPWVYNASSGNWSANGSEEAGSYSHSTLTSPTVVVNTSGSVRVDFEHLYSFEIWGWWPRGAYGPIERFDGGAVFVSINGDAFTKVTSEAFLSNGYTGVVDDLAAGGVLDGQEAFCGNSPDGVASINVPSALPPQLVVSTFELDLNAGDTLAVQFLGSWDGSTASYPDLDFLPPNWLVNSVSINENSNLPLVPIPTMTDWSIVALIVLLSAFGIASKMRIS